MFLNDVQYKYVLKLIDGTALPNSLFLELAEWAKSEFGVKIYDYIRDTTVNGRKRLVIVLWDHESAEFFHNGPNYNPEVQKAFRDKFALLTGKYNIHLDYQDADDIFVCYDTISDQIRSKLLWSLKEKICALQSSDIWKIEILFGSVHIFYETDAQIEIHSTDGVSESLRKKISDIVKPHDKYNVFPNGVSCVFTSHQTLDEKYSGSMFYYTR